MDRESHRETIKTVEGINLHNLIVALAVDSHSTTIHDKWKQEEFELYEKNQLREWRRGSLQSINNL